MHINKYARARLVIKQNMSKKFDALIEDALGLNLGMECIPPFKKSRSVHPAPHVFKRELLLLGAAGTAVDTRTLLNSVLSGYGLPTISSAKGFRAYDNFDSDYEFLYPKSWVLRKCASENSRELADPTASAQVVVEELDVVNDFDLDDTVIGVSVAPTSNPQRISSTERLSFPSPEAVKREEAVIDGRLYTYFQFPSEVVTNSGYNIKRRNFAVAARKGKRLFVLSASARSDQYNEAKAEQLLAVVQSFRVRGGAL